MDKGVQRANHAVRELLRNVISLFVCRSLTIFKPLTVAILIWVWHGKMPLDTDTRGACSSKTFEWIEIPDYKNTPKRTELQAKESPVIYATEKNNNLAGSQLICEQKKK